MIVKKSGKDWSKSKHSYPIGWPMDTAPPWTLHLSISKPSVFWAAMGTQLKASFTSHKSMSLTLRPACARSQQ